MIDERRVRIESLAMAAASEVIAEVLRACKKWPVGSTDPLVHLSIIIEEVGEAARALNDKRNLGKEWAENFREELTQIGAMAIRALMELYPEENELYE